MPQPLKVIFLEDHNDPAAAQVIHILSGLLAMGFKNFYDEQDSNSTSESMLAGYVKANAGLEKEIASLTSPAQRDERTMAIYSMDINRANHAFLKRVLECGLTYKAIDLPGREALTFELIEKAQEDKEAMAALQKLIADSNQLMLGALMAAKENTFAILGYLHGPQIMEELMKLPQETRDSFLFIFVHKESQSDNVDAFIEKANNSQFPLPLHCINFSRLVLKPVFEKLLGLIQENLAKPAHEERGDARPGLRI